MSKKKHPNRGSTLDAFLEEEGVKETFEGQAIKEVIEVMVAKDGIEPPKQGFSVRSVAT